MLKDNCAEVSVLTQKEREILDFIGAFWAKIVQKSCLVDQCTFVTIALFFIRTLR